MNRHLQPVSYAPRTCVGASTSPNADWERRTGADSFPATIVLRADAHLASGSLSVPERAKPGDGDNTLAGHPQQLGEFVHQAVPAWLQQRQATWPYTPNRHVLVSAVTATGTAPVSDYYLSWHLLLRGVALEQIRGDRVLHEALAVRAGPLHLAAVFHLSTATAIAYTDRPHPARTARRVVRDRS